MKVLFLPSEWPHNEESLDGIFVRNQVKALREAQVETDVVFVEPRHLRRFRLAKLKDSHFQVVNTAEPGGKAFRLRGWNPLISTDLGGRVYAHLVKRLALSYIERNGRPDILHAHNALWGGVAGAWVKEETGIPLVITEHSSCVMSGALGGEARKHISHAYAAADCLIAVSRALAGAVAGYTDGRPISIVPNVVDTDFFSFLRREPRNRFTLVSVSRLDQNKGIDVLLRAFHKTIECGCGDVELLIAGAGPEKDSLESLVRELGLIGKVRFLGQLTPTEVREALWMSDILVLSSYRETFGVVLIEAMATGMPVISTRSGGADDIVAQEVGILVDPGDVTGLARAIIEIRKSMISPLVIREYAERRYGQQAVSKALIRNYLTVLGRARRTVPERSSLSVRVAASARRWIRGLGARVVSRIASSHRWH